MYGVPINVAPYSTINFSPVHPVRCPIFVNRIDNLQIELLDQNGLDIDFTNEGTQTAEAWNIVISVEEYEFKNLL